MGRRATVTDGTTRRRSPHGVRAHYLQTHEAILSDEAMPADVRNFIHTKIESISELEALLLLRNQAPNRVTTREVAHTLKLGEVAAGRLLFDLMARGLVVLKDIPTLAYQFEPRSPEWRVTMHNVVELYAARPALILNAILSRPSRSLRLFSDAFRLRPDPEDRH